MSALPLFSVVIPVYRSNQTLEALVNDLCEKIGPLSTAFEIILVDDDSPDSAWLTISNMAGQNPRIKGVKLSRNFGQHPAIIAGLGVAKGEWVVVMDADFQDNPAYIPVMFNEAQSTGCDLVLARRKQRTDSLFKKITNKFFYSIFSYLTDTAFDNSIGNFGLYNRKVIQAVLSMKEPFQVFSLMVRWVGFQSRTIEVLHGTRKSGKSSYTFSKLLQLAITIIITYTTKPMMLMINIGVIISTLSFLFAAYNIVAYFFKPGLVVGYTSIIVSIWFLGGLIIFLLGVLGLYISKILEGVKHRPNYIIDSKINV